MAARVNPDITSLRETLQAVKAVIPNDVLRDIVITRIFVRTGVNLREIRPEQDRDPGIVEEVIKTFDEIGYPLVGVAR